VIFIKSWAKLAGINDAKDQTLSSYTLTLMVVHYLQAGVEPPVLPSLQNLYPSTFGSYASFAQFSFLRDLPVYHSQNTMSLGTFFDH
jgi:poly(A) RNA polymerase GLD2